MPPITSSVHMRCRRSNRSPNPSASPAPCVMASRETRGESAAPASSRPASATCVPIPSWPRTGALATRPTITLSVCEFTMRRQRGHLQAQAEPADRPRLVGPDERDRAEERAQVDRAHREHDDLLQAGRERDARQPPARRQHGHDRDEERHRAGRGAHRDRAEPLEPLLDVAERRDEQRREDHAGDDPEHLDRVVAAAPRAARRGRRAPERRAGMPRRSRRPRPRRRAAWTTAGVAPRRPARRRGRPRRSAGSPARSPPRRSRVQRMIVCARVQTPYPARPISSSMSGTEISAVSSSEAAVTALAATLRLSGLGRVISTGWASP